MAVVKYVILASFMFWYLFMILCNYGYRRNLVLIRAPLEHKNKHIFKLENFFFKQRTIASTVGFQRAQCKFIPVIDQCAA